MINAINFQKSPIICRKIIPANGENLALDSDIHSADKALMAYSSAIVHKSNICFLGTPIVLNKADTFFDSASEFPSIEEFCEKLNKLPCKYVGEIPEDFSKGGACAKKICKTFDRMAEALRPMNSIMYSGIPGDLNSKRLEFPEFKIKLGSQPLKIKDFAYGAYGRVYKVSIDDKDYALKIFQDPELLYRHGSYGEIMANFFMSQFHISNCSKFHFASPKAGWMVTEWVSPKKQLDLSGETFDKVLKRLNLEWEDGHDWNMNPNGIIWDIGGLFTKNSGELKNIGPDNMDLILEDPKLRQNWFSNIRKAINYQYQNEAGKAVEKAVGINLMPEDFKFVDDSFNECLFEENAYQDSHLYICRKYNRDVTKEQIDLIRKINHDAINESNAEYSSFIKKHIDKFIYKAYESPYTRRELAHALVFLSPEKRKKMIQEGIAFPDFGHVVTGNMYGLSPEETTDLFYRGINVRETRTTMASMLANLPENQRMNAFEHAWKFKECRPVLTACRKHLPPEYQDRALRLIKSDTAATLVYMGEKLDKADEKDKSGIKFVMKMLFRKFLVQNGLF